MGITFSAIFSCSSTLLCPSGVQMMSVHEVACFLTGPSALRILLLQGSCRLVHFISWWRRHELCTAALDKQQLWWFFETNLNASFQCYDIRRQIALVFALSISKTGGISKVIHTWSHNCSAVGCFHRLQNVHKTGAQQSPDGGEVQASIQCTWNRHEWSYKANIINMRTNASKFIVFQVDTGALSVLGDNAGKLMHLHTIAVGI